MKKGNSLPPLQKIPPAPFAKGGIDSMESVKSVVMKECVCRAVAGSMDSPVKPENDKEGGHIGPRIWWDILITEDIPML